MTSWSRGAGRALLLLCVICAGLLLVAPAGFAKAPSIDWQPCADADGFDCAGFAVPLDYKHPGGRSLDLAVARLPAKDQANKIGSLFVNYGGPGGDAVATTKAIGADLFAALNERFDIVAFDPRGTGETEDPIDCKANQETLGVYRQPFTTPENLDVGDWLGVNKRYIKRCLKLNPKILPYVSTANVARDMDRLRAAVGDRKLSYLGFSYGTFLGATYASLFPHHYRALVLDGAIDADKYINRPMQGLREQSSAFERALDRFFQACAANQVACAGFGGDDPHAAFDELVERLDADPQPASATDPRLVDGDDVLSGALTDLYAKQFWPYIAAALAAAEAGNYAPIRGEADISYGRLDDGTYDPGLDRYFAIGALEQRYPSDLGTFMDAGQHSWNLFDHFWWNAGYVELPWGLWPVKPRGAFYGPFQTKKSDPTTLVVGTTYDPATPYRGAKRLVSELGNARLLTMRGDGHTAYGGNSACIDAAVDAYVVDGTLPAPGTVCQQEVPFEPLPAPVADTLQLQAAPASQVVRRPHVKPVLGRSLR
jgi:pimeloyl-ACP methyl ester carboxylesterase